MRDYLLCLCVGLGLAFAVFAAERVWNLTSAFQTQPVAMERSTHLLAGHP